MSISTGKAIGLSIRDACNTNKYYVTDYIPVRTPIRIRTSEEVIKRLRSLDLLAMQDANACISKLRGNIDG